MKYILWFMMIATSSYAFDWKDIPSELMTNAHFNAAWGKPKAMQAKEFTIQAYKQRDEIIEQAARAGISVAPGNPFEGLDSAMINRYWNGSLAPEATKDLEARMLKRITNLREAVSQQKAFANLVKPVKISAPQIDVARELSDRKFSVGIIERDVQETDASQIRIVRELRSEITELKQQVEAIGKKYDDMRLELDAVRQRAEQPAQSIWSP